jgi:hypothetical protein
VRTFGACVKNATWSKGQDQVPPDRASNCLRVNDAQHPNGRMCLRTRLSPQLCSVVNGMGWCFNAARFSFPQLIGRQVLLNSTCVGLLAGARPRDALCAGHVANSPQFPHSKGLVSSPRRPRLWNLRSLQTMRKLGLLKRLGKRSVNPSAPKAEPSEARARSERYGLMLLAGGLDARPDDAGTEQYPVDIIAVHGLNGDAYTTWTHKNGGSVASRSTPRPPSRLPVFTFGYPSQVVFSTSSPKSRSMPASFLAR